MNTTESPITLETCPACTKQTAAHLFRETQGQRLCLLCAQRADADAVATAAREEDRRLHGGMGWLWKHVAVTAYAAVGLIIIRYLFIRYFSTP